MGLKLGRDGGGLPFPTVAEYTDPGADGDVEVAGAGDEEQNGLYLRIADFGGFPQWQKEEGTGAAWTIRYNAGIGRWYMRNALSVAYQDLDDNAVDYPWQVPTWSAAAGTAPAPTVSVPAPVDPPPDRPDALYVNRVEAAFLPESSTEDLYVYSGLGGGPDPLDPDWQLTAIMTSYLKLISFEIHNTETGDYVVATGITEPFTIDVEGFVLNEETGISTDYLSNPIDWIGIEGGYTLSFIAPEEEVSSDPDLTPGKGFSERNGFKFKFGFKTKFGFKKSCGF